MRERIIGIDPGSSCTGWGIIEVGVDRPVHLAHGTVAMNRKQPVALRLASICREITAVACRYRVQDAALESVFVAANSKSALKLGQARGAALVALGRQSVDCFEYAPTSVKLAVTGSGRAAKAQVGAMVRNLLGLQGELNEDAADALAVALCHLFKSRAANRIRRFSVSL